MTPRPTEAHSWFLCITQEQFKYHLRVCPSPLIENKPLFSETLSGLTDVPVLLPIYQCGLLEIIIVTYLFSGFFFHYYTISSMKTLTCLLLPAVFPLFNMVPEAEQ